MSIDPKAQIEQLIDFALNRTDENSEEARTAALTAVRLFRKHGFRVTESAPEPPKALAGWDIVFQRSGGREAFLRAVQWSERDLDRVTIDRKSVSDAKIWRLNHWLFRIRTNIPLEPTHPLIKRLVQLIEKFEQAQRDEVRERAMREDEAERNFHARHDVDVGPVVLETHPRRSGAGFVQPPPVVIVTVNGPKMQRATGSGVTEVTLGRLVGMAVDFVGGKKR